MSESRTAWRTAVAGEVRALMGRHRVPQKRLAEAIGISQPGLSRRLCGDVPFDVDDLYAIARYFDVPVTDLLAPATLPTDTRSGSSVGGLLLVGAGN